MVRIKDIAKKAGVSPSTVSIIINGKAEERNISAKTQEKVQRLIKELNYIPNISAKTIRSGGTQEYVVALFCNFDSRSIMMTRLLNGIQNCISINNDDIKIVIYPFKSGNLKEEDYHFNGTDFHAAIIASANSDDLEYLSGRSFTLPIILYNRILNGFSSVNVDDNGIGKASAKHLFEKGYRKPAIFHADLYFPGSSNRVLSFIDTMKDFGITIPKEHIFSIGSSIKEAVDFTEQILSNYPADTLPDCFFCTSDNIALGLVNTLTSHGIRVPEDIGIISVGNIEPEFSKYNNPSLTVVDIPIEKMGAGCYDFIKKSRYDYSHETEQHFYETVLYVRKSTQRF